MKLSVLIAIGALGCAAPALAQPADPAFMSPTTMRDFVGYCAAAPADPLFSAKVNFCQGFAEGAIAVERSYDAAMPRMRKMFCIPQPAPSRNAAVADLVVWMNNNPSHGGDAPADGLFRFLGDRFPCPTGKR